MPRSLGSAGIGSSSGSSRSGLSSGMPSKPSPGLSRKAERASSRTSRPSAEFKRSRNGLRRWAARPYKSSLSSLPMPLARDFESSPDGQPSPFGSKSRGKKEQVGLTNPDAVAMPRRAFHTHASCSPGWVGRGWDINLVRWLNRVSGSSASAGAMHCARYGRNS